MIILDVNWIAVLAASIAYFVLGGVWFSPFAFGKSWDKGIGFDRPAAWKPSSRYYIVPLISCFVISLATAVLLDAVKVQSFSDAIILGLVGGIGYAATVSGIMAISPTIPRPALLSIVVGVYHVSGIVIGAVIIFALGH